MAPKRNASKIAWMKQNFHKTRLRTNHSQYAGMNELLPEVVIRDHDK